MRSMYTAELEITLLDQLETAIRGLESLQLRCVEESWRSTSKEEHEYFAYGVARRVSVMRTALGNVFSLFPVDTKIPIRRENLVDAQINLHAFVINVSGTFDNFAWAYLCRHNLNDKFPDARRIGMFRREFQVVLPDVLVQYLNSQKFQNWYKPYLTYYRDALAHRIPLYIPPAHWTKEQAGRYQELDQQIHAAIQAHDFERAETMRNEQDTLGTPCDSFYHTFLGDGLKKGVVLHPQLIADSLTVIEFGNLFFNSWLDPTQSRSSLG